MQKRGVIFTNYYLPKSNPRRIGLDFIDCLLKFSQNACRGHSIQLWIYWPEVGLFPHHNFFARTGNHGSRRHGDLRNNCPNIDTEHSPQIVHKRLCRTNRSAWRV